jgi:hypothetical protein
MKKYVLLLVIIIIYSACQTVPDYEDLSSEFIVATNRDMNAAFDDYDTFYISDTIVNLGGTDSDTIWHDEDAAQLVAAVKENMAARGYSYVQRHQGPDIAMQMGIVKVLNIEYYPGWWWGYPGWYPFYGGGYYPYYPWSTVYAYETGSIILDAYDAENADNNDQFRALWMCSSFGALGDNESANINRGINSIDQAFDQSPYFQAN